MANEEHLAILRQGVEVWNTWRGENPEVTPDLCEADLTMASLNGADLRWANLHRARLSTVDLAGAELVEANLRGADLSAGDLFLANLLLADLSEANLSKADLTGTNLTRANLDGAELAGANVSTTAFTDIDLSRVRGLEAVHHDGPSSIGIDTLFRSNGKIPHVFLRGCGVPESLIENLPELLGAMQLLQFYSCFISYSSKDESFAQRLYIRMREKKLRVWFDQHDIRGGKKILDQIDEAIRVHDKTLLVLSEHSLRSSWVKTELRKAYKAEVLTKGQKLFPIRLIDMEALKRWESIDVDTGEDLALYLRSYHIPDFSHWKEPDAFEEAFEKLLRDLQYAEKLKSENGRAVPD